MTRDLGDDDRPRPSRSERLLRAILDHAGEAVIAIDKDRRIIEFNRTAETMFGYPAAEVVGGNVNVLMPEPERAAHDGYVQAYQRSGVAKIIGLGREVRARRKDGTVFAAHLTIAETDVAGEQGFVGTIRDLTERKQLQAQLLQAQKMEAIGQLTGGIAHDFNNLLTVMLGNIDFLSDALEGKAELKPALDLLEMAAQRAADLTRSLVAFSRNQPLEPESTDVNRLLARLEKLLRSTLGAQVRIRLVSSHDLWPAEVDPAQLEAAILNLALNARDAMPDGGALIIETANVELDQDYVRLNGGAFPGRYVMISVSDTGTGMTPEVVAKAFEPFFTTKEVGKGSGLGLSMVYGFVRQSRGHVKIYSEVGRGTTIKIYLPPSSKAGLPEAARVGPAPIVGGSETILMVEDDDMVRASVQAQLTGLGYDVLTARDAAQALEILRRKTPIDLLFSDVVMPGGMDGRQLADAALRLRPGLKVLLTSGYSRYILAESDGTGGRYDLLTKPYHRHELAAKLRLILAGSRAAP